MEIFSIERDAVLLVKVYYYSDIYILIIYLFDSLSVRMNFF